MSFVSKNLQQTTNAMSFIKGATLFFLGMSVVLFLTQAFDIVPVATEVKGYFKTIILTSNGSNTAATGIELDGNLGRGHFVGNVDVDSSVNANTVNATTINGTTVNGTTVKGTMISGATVRGTTVCVNGECRTSRPKPAGNDTTLQFKAGAEFSGSDNLVRDNANGRLGIGIFTPTEVLDVNGTGKFTSVQIGTTMSLLSSSSYGVIQSATGLAFNTSGSSTGKMVIDTAGNVGIGTSSPSEKVQIGEFAWIGKNYQALYATGGAFLKLVGGSNGINQCLLPPCVSYNPNIQLNKYLDDSFDNRKIENNGASLTLGYNNGIPTSGYQNKLILSNQGNLHLMSGSIIHATDSSTSNQIFLAGNGNVGIGTNNPQAKLTVNGGIKVKTRNTDPCSNTGTYPAGTMFYVPSHGYSYYCTDLSGTVGCSSIVMPDMYCMCNSDAIAIPINGRYIATASNTNQFAVTCFNP